MFRPYPKPSKREKKVKKKAPAKKRTSSGELVTEQQVSYRLSKAYSENLKPSESLCQCCKKVMAKHHDHSISQRACKIFKKTELIWTPKNWSLSCEKCHHEWESYKSGLFTRHKNFIQRMSFVKTHDIEGFNKRMIYVTVDKMVFFK